MHCRFSRRRDRNVLGLVRHPGVSPPGDLASPRTVMPLCPRTAPELSQHPMQVLRLRACCGAGCRGGQPLQGHICGLDLPWWKCGVQRYHALDSLVALEFSPKLGMNCWLTTVPKSLPHALTSAACYSFVTSVNLICFYLKECS